MVCDEGDVHDVVAVGEVGKWHEEVVGFPVGASPIGAGMPLVYRMRRHVDGVGGAVEAGDGGGGAIDKSAGAFAPGGVLPVGVG